MIIRKLKAVLGKLLIFIGSIALANGVSAVIYIVSLNVKKETQSFFLLLPRKYGFYFIFLPMVATIFYFSNKWLSSNFKKRKVIFFFLISVLSLVFSLAAMDVKSNY